MLLFTYVFLLLTFIFTLYLIFFSKLLKSYIMNFFLEKRNFVWTAEAYHAGLTAPRRRSIQKQFMTGKFKICLIKF